MGSAEYRAVLGHFATGVAVVTAMGEDGPVGIAVNSFTSVSLDPPLVAFCAANGSTSWKAIDAAGHYCVNVLADTDEELCRAMATKGVDRFRGVAWRAGTSGAPKLDGALAWVDCRIEDRHDAGDHVIVVGRVLELGHAASGRPLLFYRGNYAALDR